jgi:hypothetical protein
MNQGANPSNGGASLTGLRGAGTHRFYRGFILRPVGLDARFEVCGAIFADRH